MSAITVIKVGRNNEGYYTFEAYKELRLQMSTGDFHDHSHEVVEIDSDRINEVIQLDDLEA